MTLLGGYHFKKVIHRGVNKNGSDLYRSKWGQLCSNSSLDDSETSGQGRIGDLSFKARRDFRREERLTSQY